MTAQTGTGTGTGTGETVPYVPPAPGPNVYQLISSVSAELAETGISKGRQNLSQNYMFRGIDDVYNELAPILSKHGLVILPRFVKRESQPITTAKGGTLFFVTVEAEFDFVSAHDGTRHVVRTFGEAMDAGDKATNKAMSAAYKYACFQTFCIPTEGDHDSENQTHAVQPEAATAPVTDPRPAPPARASAPVVQHPSVPPQAAKPVAAPRPPAAEPDNSAGVCVKEVLKKRSGMGDKGPWNLWWVTFTTKVKASDGTFTNRASTFDDGLAATADNFRAAERPVVPVITPSEKSKGFYDLQKFELQA